MANVDIDTAKDSLPALVMHVQLGVEREVVLTRSGRPIARIVPLEAPRRLRVGLAKGRYRAPADLDDVSPEVAAQFGLRG
jgi:antitoxin (DNA-binding transcriptional repressor) of toxin-antitoxin stability system